MKRQLAVILFLVATSFSAYSQTISGTVKDDKGEPVIGANVIIKGTTIGTTTDFDGNYSLDTKGQELPFTLEISFIGYSTFQYEIKSLEDSPRIELQPNEEVLGDVDVIAQRLSEKQRESALTVEALDNLAIKETPAVNFYEALGNLKGVDLTSASIGFKIINTRGFNSTSPVRSLQLIDGVDNQAPGLNFSLGNFLGASELDILNVDIIAGASTAFFGPGAFNGVISMQTKSPFDFEGISASVKVGERALTETAVRYAEAFKIGKDKGFKNFAFKLNLYYLTANDWEADNYNPIDDSEVPATNPGGFDAVNIYGDEDLGAVGFDQTGPVERLSRPGLERFYRDGYREVDIVDYDTRNFKGGVGLFYRFTEDLELSYNFGYGTGTTVYQGENRFSLNNIQFYQNTIELRKKDKFFIKAYATQEDAGNSYDAVLTAFKMNQAITPDRPWASQYQALWETTGFQDSVKALVGSPAPGQSTVDWMNTQYLDTIAKYQDLLTSLHARTREFNNTLSFPRPEPGTQEFDSLFNYVTSRTFVEGGSKFYDRSALYHIMGEYQFHPEWADIRVGGNYRFYAPDSRGNIFDELVLTDRLDTAGRIIGTDTSFRKITNSEFGVYLGVEKKFVKKRLKVSLTARMDKNENFNAQFSPALSLVYLIDENNTVRLSFSSAIRNPTLQDQYLRYDVGRAILLGNLNGKDSLVTLESFDAYRDEAVLDRDNLVYFDAPPIKPEKVRTFEIGYRGSLFKRLFVDGSYYYSLYEDFIGYQFGIELGFDNPFAPDFFTSLQAFRVATNSQDQVNTQGLNLGLNYYLTDELTLNGNYSWNTLDLRGSNDPIIPAFNTPENKFNLGITGRGYKLAKNKDHKLGFAVNYKWVQGFRFEGSPQFTGNINDYGLVDAQVSYQVPKWYTTFKLGASNILDNQVFQVYGGPTVGRMAYFSILFEKF